MPDTSRTNPRASPPQNPHFSSGFLPGEPQESANPLVSEFRWCQAPKGLATRRQLRAMGLRPEDKSRPPGSSAAAAAASPGSTESTSPCRRAHRPWLRRQHWTAPWRPVPHVHAACAAVLLFGFPYTRLLSLTIHDVIVSDDGVEISIDGHSLRLPPRVDQLLLEQGK